MTAGSSMRAIIRPGEAGIQPTSHLDAGLRRSDRDSVEFRPPDCRQNGQPDLSLLRTRKPLTKWHFRVELR